MLPEKQLLSSVIIHNRFDIMPKVNPIWFRDNINMQVWRNAVLCFSQHKELNIEILKTWVYAQESKVKNIIISRIVSLDEIYPPENVIENMQEYYVNNCLNEYMGMHTNKEATTESKKQLFNEIYKKINTNIDLDESRPLEESINEYIKNVLQDKVSDRFNQNSIKLQDENLRSIFGYYLRPWPIIIAGNPGFHKTSTMVNLLVNIDKQRLPGLIFSFEDTIDTLRNKYISIKTGLPIENIVNNKYNEYEKEVLIRARKTSNRIWIIDKPCNVLKFRQIIDKHIVTYDIKYILIDYFQLFYGLKGLSKVEGLEQVAKELVNIRKDYEIPIIVLSQLNTEEGQEPQLTDLKWCKALGESARQVFMLFNGEDDCNRTIKCCKNTFASTFKKEISFDRKSQQVLGVINDKQTN